MGWGKGGNTGQLGRQVPARQNMAAPEGWGRGREEEGGMERKRERSGGGMHRLREKTSSNRRKDRGGAVVC